VKNGEKEEKTGVFEKKCPFYFVVPRKMSNFGENSIFLKHIIDKNSNKEL
jgi:hypothetical protein